MLTPEQRAELEKYGPTTVRFKLLASGSGLTASVPGFKSGSMTRDDIEGWLAEKNKEEAAQQSSILDWARIAGVAGIVSAILTLIGIAISVWTSGPK
jgi:hypothetical protein